LVNGISVLMAKLMHDPGNAIMVAFGEAGSNGSFKPGEIVR